MSMDAVTPSPRHWRLASSELQGWSRALPSELHLETAEAQIETIDILDSFSWDLWRQGRLLCRHGNGYHRLCGANDTLIAQAQSKAKPRFWWELPAGRLRSSLKSACGFWSFNPVASLRLERHKFSLRNEDHKIVARLLLARTQGANGKQAYLSLLGLRGYLQEFDVVAERLAQVLKTDLGTLGLQQMLQDQGVTPTQAIKSIPAISPTQKTESAVRQMACAMSTKARIYEAGIRHDTDTEFLHQYRVSLRKARSLTSLMKNAFEPTTYARLKRLLAELSGPTGELRDLDVFLLERARYSAMLPESFDAGLKLLFRKIARERGKAHKILVARLSAPEHEQAYADLMALLQAEPEYQTRMARQTIDASAHDRTLRRYHKIIQLGNALHEGTPDPDIHALRIECKKLRYLLEFFVDLFGHAQSRHLISDMKGLQDVLGQFNDYSVQQEFLLRHGQQPRAPTELIRTVGGLTAVLHQQQREARSRVQAAFKRFARPQVTADFHALLRPEAH